MSKQAFFIVYDLSTGDLKRHGKCPAEHMEAQARPGKGEGVMADEPRSQEEARVLLLEQRMVLPKKGAPYLRPRPAAEIEARRPKVVTPGPTLEHLIALLRKKGINITDTELADAAGQTPTP